MFVIPRRTANLNELNRNLEVKVRKRVTRLIGSKRRLVAADYGPLAEAFIRIYMDDTVDKMFGVHFKNGKFLIGNNIIKIQGDNIVIGNVVYVRFVDFNH